MGVTEEARRDTKKIGTHTLSEVLCVSPHVFPDLLFPAFSSISRIFMCCFSMFSFMSVPRFLFLLNDLRPLAMRPPRRPLRGSGSAETRPPGDVPPPMDVLSEGSGSARSHTLVRDARRLPTRPRRGERERGRRTLRAAICPRPNDRAATESTRSGIGKIAPERGGNCLPQKRGEYLPLRGEYLPLRGERLPLRVIFQFPS